ncbi:50S ribosomal protein L16 [Candidatus Woesearchaeota archaeon]|nr:50S ribosomal protein L16 [Candidatus Woesearchaeota archaeon]
MAKLRKFVAYRRLERSYTRRSKFRKKSYVRSGPVNKVIRFHMGNQLKPFSHVLKLISKGDLQIRHNAIEAARQTCNRLLEASIGKTQYYLIVRMYPHHILRENPLASGAGADRMSTGMARSFGKAIGLAAQVHKNHPMFELRTDANQLKTAKIALKRAASKLPCKTQILIEEAVVKA